MASRNSNGNGILGAVLRVVLYLRMSSDEQVESIPSQRAELQKYALKHGYQIVGEYVDEGISGDRTEQRLGFLAMRDDAEQGKFDVVLAWSQDRFGRFDLLDGGYWIYPFRRAGVRLETIAEGRIDWEDLTGQLVYSVNQLGKAQFLRDLSRNVTRGLVASAREGRAGTGGQYPFGYRSKGGEVWIVPEEAETVRLVFDLYLQPGGTGRGVAAELNRRGVAPPRGKAWQCSSVRAILGRRKYTGTFVYGERSVGRYFAMGGGEIVPRRKSDKSVLADPVVIPDRFEAIIDQETFDKVQAKRLANKRKTSPRSAWQYRLSGLVKCGDCGGAMVGIRRSSYRCHLYQQSGRTVCYCNTIREAPLVEVVRRKIQEQYTGKASLDRLRKALEREQERTAPRPRDLARLRKEIEDLDRKIDSGEEAVLEAPVELRSGLYRKLQDLTSRRDRLKADLASLASRDARRTDRDSLEVERAINALRRLGEALRKAKPEETRELLASIVSRIELHFDHQETGEGRIGSSFSHGTIYLRPDAGGGRAVDPESTHMSKTVPYRAIQPATDQGVPPSRRRITAGSRRKMPGARS